jgi:hypothetical protein
MLTLMAPDRAVSFLLPPILLSPPAGRRRRHDTPCRRPDLAAATPRHRHAAPRLLPPRPTRPQLVPASPEPAAALTGTTSGRPDANIWDAASELCNAAANAVVSTSAIIPYGMYTYACVTCS